MNEDKMELEEAIKKCEDFINENKSRPIILHKAIKTVLQALKNKDKTTADDAEDEITRFKKVILKDYIPKKKIEDKIQELNNAKKSCNTTIIKMQYLCKLNILQELLEDK